MSQFVSVEFEYGVILNGSKTVKTEHNLYFEFEYGVILNGSKTMYTP